MNHIEELIKRSGKTKYLIAKEVGMPYNSLRRYCSGEADISNMPLKYALKLSKILKVEPGELARKEDDFMKGFADFGFKEGWNDYSPRLSILCEDGNLIRGIIEEDGDQHTVYPYVRADGNYWNRIDDRSVEHLKEIAEAGKLSWR